jgi:hypothetical protein
LVTAGIRIKYAGSEDVRAGQIVTLEEPNHSSLDGKTITFMKSFQTSRTFRPPAGDEWICLVTTGPVNASELNFATDTTAAEPTYNAHYLLIMFDGLPPGTQFEYEAYANFECTGANVREKNKSDIDHAGGNLANAGMDDVGGYGSHQTGHLISNVTGKVADGLIKQSGTVSNSLAAAAYRKSIIDDYAPYTVNEPVSAASPGKDLFGYNLPVSKGFGTPRMRETGDDIWQKAGDRLYAMGKGVAGAAQSGASWLAPYLLSGSMMAGRFMWDTHGQRWMNQGADFVDEVIHEWNYPYNA